MIPGMNMRQAQHMMRKMGISQQEIEADTVVIRSATKEIIISNPQVSKVNMMGQDTYQIIGKVEERALDSTPEISEDDIKTVMEQTGQDHDEAKTALLKSKGDLAAAILSFSP